MFYSENHAHLWKILHRGMAICLVLTVILGTLPWGTAQAETNSAPAPAPLSGAQPQAYQPPPTHPDQGWAYPNSSNSAAPMHADQSPEYMRSGQLQWESSSAMRHPEKDVSFLDDIIGPTRQGSGTTQVYDRTVEVSYVGTWLSPGSHDWIWGNALPGSTVTVTAPTETLELNADPENDGFWVVSTSLEPGDAITVTAGDGLNPVSFSIATPFTAEANSDTGEVNGQVGGWGNDSVYVHTHWDDVDTLVETDADGIYTVTLADIPQGGSGNVHYSYVEDGADIESQLWFRAPDLLLDVFPSWDSIEGVYALGHDITLVVFDSDNNLKASITIPVEELWGSITGFNTAEHPDLWVDSQPDIVSGDKIYGYVGDGSMQSAYVQVGEITGVVDVDMESISGTITVPWDPSPDTVWVECHPWGAPDGAPNKWVEVTLDGSGEGTYTCEWDPTTEWDVGTNQDIAVSIQDPEGHRTFEVFNEPSYDLYMDINYAHDWIEGWYPPGYEVTLTVKNHDQTEPKGTTTLMTGEIPWWGGGTGFSTSLEGTVWDPPGQPDIEAGDWVFGEVTVGETPYTAEVKLGTIDGRVDITADSFTGTVDADWLNPSTLVQVQCHPWGAPEGTNHRETNVLPDGTDEFTCDWSDEWDIQPNQNIAVLYQDPAGHWVWDVFTGYSNEPILEIHYDHDWISGQYAPGHMIYLEVEDSLGNLKGSITLESQVFPDGWSGFTTYQDGAYWSSGQPDIEPGDWVYAEVIVDQMTYTAEVKIGTITGVPDVGDDTVTGKVAADWLLVDPYNVAEVDVSCEIWEQDGPPPMNDTVIPNGVDEYFCDFSGEWDLQPGSNLMVSYYEPDGHRIIGDFRPPAPYLRIQKWLMADASPGVGSNAEFQIYASNDGNGTAEDVVITDTMDGFTYISDTSGVTPTVDINGDGNQVVTWTFGALDAYSWLDFNVFVAVTAAGGVEVSNLVEISTSNPFDQGDPEEKWAEWTGTVKSNTTDLNVWIDPWTWNPAAGENFVYTVGVCNNGDTGSLPITLDISFIENLTLYDGLFGVWWARESGWQEVSSDSGKLTLSRPTIAGGHCLEVYVRATVDALAEPGDGLYTEAEVLVANETHPEDNETSIWHHVGEPTTDVEIWQNWHWGSLVPGGYYRYSINFRNSGNLQVSDSIAVTATLPPGTSFAGWDKWGWASVADPDVNGQSITWQVNVRDPGFMGTIEVWVNIKHDTVVSTVLEHLAEIEIQPGEGYTENNTSTMTEMVNDYGPNLRIRKEGGIHGYGDGHYAWYGLTVENIGDETVNEVVITDHYPVGMILDGELNVNFWEYWERDLYPDHFEVTLSRLEPGWNMQINYNTYVSDLSPGEIFENTAQVLPLAGDMNPVDNTASYAMATGPDMYVEKTLDSGTFEAGEQVTYLLTFGNLHHANDWWWDMTGNAILTDTLPEGMSFVSATQRWCDSSEWCEITPTIDGQTLTWNLYPIGRSNWNQILLTVEIDEAVAKNNPLINQVSITSENLEADVDPYPQNNNSIYDPEIASSFNLFLPLMLR